MTCYWLRYNFELSIILDVKMFILICKTDRKMTYNILQECYIEEGILLVRVG